MRQYSTFYLGEDRFAIDILLVKEINRHLEITDVAGLPEYVRGLLNLRGKIVTVFDLACRIGRERCEMTPNTRCVVLKTNEELRGYQEAGLINDSTGPDVVGLLIDRIGDMIFVDDNQVDPAPANIIGVDDRFFSGVVLLEGELLVTLNAMTILAEGAGD